MPLYTLLIRTYIFLVHLRRSTRSPYEMYSNFHVVTEHSDYDALVNQLLPEAALDLSDSHNMPPLLESS